MPERRSIWGRLSNHPRADTALAALLVIVALALRLAFRYSGGFGDANVIHMATGMASGVAHSLPFAETLEYGKNISLGVYAGFRILYPLFFEDASSTVTFLNAVGLMAGSLVYAPLYFLFRSTLPRSAALSAAIVVMLGPVVWENETYFQPVTLALLFFLLAVSCGRRMASTPAGMLWGLAAFLFGLASVLSRAEIVLGVPALLLASVRLGGRRQFLRAVGLTLAIGVTTLVLLLGMGSGVASQGSDLGPYMRSFLTSYIVPASALRNLVWAALGIGIASLASVSWGLIRARPLPSRIQADRASLLMWMGTILLFWIWNPVPLLRHYYLIVPALAWLLGEFIFRHGSARRAILVALLIGATNLMLPELLYGVHAARSQGPPKTPHGTFFSWHARKTGDVVRVREFARETVALVARRHMLEPGVLLKEYRGRGIALHEVRCNWLSDPEARRVVCVELERALTEGVEVILSREAARLLELTAPSSLLSVF